VQKTERFKFVCVREVAQDQALTMKNALCSAGRWILQKAFSLLCMKRAGT
jgi:hypothetical protein